MSDFQPETVVAQVGEEVIASVVRAFYRRVETDDLLRPMYPEADLGPAEERLRDFLIYRLGGSQAYLQKRGHPRLRMRHMPFVVDQAARDRWMELMTAALEEVELPEELRGQLGEFLGGVATFLMNR